MHVRSDVSTGNLADHVAQARGVKIDQAFVSLLVVGFTSGKRVFPHLKFPDLRTSKLSRLMNGTSALQPLRHVQFPASRC